MLRGANAVARCAEPVTRRSTVRLRGEVRPHCGRLSPAEAGSVCPPPAISCPCMQLPASVELGNRITAQEAAQRFGLGSYARLIPAIKAGIVRGYRIEVGRRCIYLVDPAELAEDLANLPMCAYCGEKPALAPSGVCSGPHARALETKGKHWRTREAIEKTAAAKRGKPRPDVRERVAAMHGDPHQRYPWHLAILEGRGRKA